MIETAKKSEIPENVIFETADATNLLYADDSFDVVVIANGWKITKSELVKGRIDLLQKQGNATKALLLTQFQELLRRS